MEGAGIWQPGSGQQNLQGGEGGPRLLSLAAGVRYVGSLAVRRPL